MGSALEYARRLKSLAGKVDDALLLVMRVYLQKPRTAIGWKGLINDPFMNDSFHMENGLFLARKLLIRLAEMGVPAATEALDPLTPQYIGDLISWTAIGARTTESQTHREMASGLSTPVGFKNGTDGDIGVAVNAIEAARHSHHFLGITEEGQSAVFHTRGNSYGHLVLRGGSVPNYDSGSIAACEKALSAARLPQTMVVDCSHGNSGKNPERQPVVLRNLVRQIIAGNKTIVGFMLESHLSGGSQKIPRNPATLKPDVSITDACLDWEATEKLLLETRSRLSVSLRIQRNLA
jgi:3-deoxy-7-phosphoheptulonate synthase